MGGGVVFDRGENADGFSSAKRNLFWGGVLFAFVERVNLEAEIQSWDVGCEVELETRWKSITYSNEGTDVTYNITENIDKFWRKDDLLKDLHNKEYKDSKYNDPHTQEESEKFFKSIPHLQYSFHARISDISIMATFQIVSAMHDTKPNVIWQYAVHVDVEVTQEKKPVHTMSQQHALSNPTYKSPHDTIREQENAMGVIISATIAQARLGLACAYLTIQPSNADIYSGAYFQCLQTGLFGRRYTQLIYITFTPPAGFCTSTVDNGEQTHFADSGTFIHWAHAHTPISNPPTTVLSTLERVVNAAYYCP
jgi:hypothetical protein